MDNSVYRILVINPGSTSTKVAVYHNEQPVHAATIKHSVEEIQQFKEIIDQYVFRKQLVLDWLRAEGIPLDFDAIIGRGGLIKPIPGGVYEVNEKMCRESYTAMRKHACNLGCIIAYELVNMMEKPCMALIADPVVVDEMIPEAHITGSPLMRRASIWHALNQRATARRYAAMKQSRYEDLNLIVCHLGGGISIAAHDHGRAIDVNNALDGEGPFSPERAGTLPSADLIHLCYSGKYTEAQLKKRIAGEAGLMAHLGTTDVEALVRRAQEGDARVKLLIDAMIFRISKSIAAQGATLYGKVDAILLTGGMAYSSYITEAIKERVGFLAPVHVFAGENEMESLAMNALAALRHECEALTYV